MWFGNDSYTLIIFPLGTKKERKSQKGPSPDALLEEVGGRRTSVGGTQTKSSSEVKLLSVYFVPSDSKGIYVFFHLGLSLGFSR